MKKLIAASLLLGTLSASVIAGPVFTVNRTIGTGYVSGTIETDGTIGVLATSNILGWNLMIDDGQGDGAFNLINPGNSGLFLAGNLFSASASQLVFDFTGGYGLALFQNPAPGSGQNWWCMEGINSNCAGTGSATESVNRFSAQVYVSHQGPTVIGVNAGNDNGRVPEPVSLALIGVGLAGLGVARRKAA